MPSTIAIKWPNVNCFKLTKCEKDKKSVVRKETGAKSLNLPLTVNARIVNRIERKVCHADL